MDPFTPQNLAIDIEDYAFYYAQTVVGFIRSKRGVFREKNGEEWKRYVLIFSLAIEFAKTTYFVSSNQAKFAVLEPILSKIFRL